MNAFTFEVSSRLESHNFRKKYTQGDITDLYVSLNVILNYVSQYNRRRYKCYKVLVL